MSIDKSGGRKKGSLNQTGLPFEFEKTVLFLGVYYIIIVIIIHAFHESFP